MIWPFYDLWSTHYLSDTEPDQSKRFQPYFAEMKSAYCNGEPFRIHWKNDDFYEVILDDFELVQDHITVLGVGLSVKYWTKPKTGILAHSY